MPDKIDPRFKSQLLTMAKQKSPQLVAVILGLADHDSAAWKKHYETLKKGLPKNKSVVALDQKISRLGTVNLDATAKVLLGLEKLNGIEIVMCNHRVTKLSTSSQIAA